MRIYCFVVAGFCFFLLGCWIFIWSNDRLSYLVNKRVKRLSHVITAELFLMQMSSQTCNLATG